jgi:uncharacterized membrane protein YebE (DUF533 family)
MSAKKAKRAAKKVKAAAKKSPAAVGKARPAGKAKPAPKKSAPAAAKAGRVSSWFDVASHKPLIAEQARRLKTFLAAVADGVIDEAELAAQEKRLVEVMKEVEPLLSPDLHARLTRLLCELTAYDLMQVMHSFHEARPKTAFQG